MAQQFSDNFQVNSPKPLDNKSGRFTQGAWRPFNNIAEAQTTVVLGARYIGFTQVILKDGVPTEYWYRDGISDSDLIVKIAETPPIETPDLQEVTNEGNITTLTITAAPAVLDTELTTLGQVNTLIADIPTIIASNGITKTGNDIKLGGLLTGATMFGFSTGTGNYQYGVYLSPTRASFGLTDNTGTVNKGFIFNGASGATLEVIDFGGGSKGLVNGGDYEANFIPRSLVTKQYVDAAISDIPPVDLTPYELKSNKQNSLSADVTNIKYPTVTAVNFGLSGKQNNLGFTPENIANKGINGGYAPVGLDGKIPALFLPSGAQIYKGIWDASTNTPTLIDGTGTAGWTYRVTVAGTQDLGSGDITFNIGDDIIYDGSIWQRNPASSTGILSVNGQTSSIVTLNTNNIPEVGDLYFTEARVRGTVLTGLSSTSGDISESDTIIQAFGKLLLSQDTISQIVYSKQNSLAIDGTGVKYPTVDAVNAGVILNQNSLIQEASFKIDGDADVGNNIIANRVLNRNSTSEAYFSGGSLEGNGAYITLVGGDRVENAGNAGLYIGDVRKLSADQNPFFQFGFQASDFGSDPSNVTNLLRLYKDGLVNDVPLNQQGVKIYAIPGFEGVGGFDLVVGNLMLTDSSARLAVSDNVELLNNGQHTFGSYNLITTEGSTANLSAYADFDSKSLMNTNVNINHYVAFQARNKITGVGDVLAYMYGYNVANIHNGSGVIANHAGVHINDIAKTSSGIVTNAYGIDIEPIESGTNNYAIRTKGGLIEFGTGISKTESTPISVGYLAKSNDANYSALQLNSFGGVTQSERGIELQTIEQGVANDGILSLQPNGGKVKVASVPDEPTDVIRLTDLSNYVNTTADQVGIAGNKTWTGIGTYNNGGTEKTLMYPGQIQMENTSTRKVLLDPFSLTFTNGAKIGALQAPVTDGSFTYNLPSGNGTLALTTQLDNYLLLSGGGLTGALTSTSSISADGGFFDTSDIRLKNVVEDTFDTSGIKAISFKWKDSSKDTKVHVGYSAQEVQKVMPDAINIDSNGKLSINYVQVLVSKIQALEDRLKQFEGGV